jgi:hypothetical protein
MSVSALETRPYYQTAVLGLRALEQREGRARRFGSEADSRWERFRGKLHEGDRLQMLLRDASAPWGLAFAGAHIFRSPGVATDEPFGPFWPSCEAKEAVAWLSSHETPTLAACARILGVEALPVSLPELRAGTRVVAGGGAAILALAQAFAGKAELDWAQQVTLVADSPAHRQLAGLASVFVGAVRPCAVWTSDRVPSSVEGVRVVSPDAEAEVGKRLS